MEKCFHLQTICPKIVLERPQNTFEGTPEYGAGPALCSCFSVVRGFHSLRRRSAENFVSNHKLAWVKALHSQREFHS